MGYEVVHTCYILAVVTRSSVITGNGEEKRQGEKTGASVCTWVPM